MDLRTLRGRVAPLILVGLSSVAAHQATYLPFLGGPTADVSSATVRAHDAFWPPLAAIVLMAAFGLGIVAIRELKRLTDAARDLPHAAHVHDEAIAYVRAVGRLWLRLGLATLVVYALQENAERLLVGLPAVGFDALSAHGMVPIVAIVVASLLVAVVAGLVRWHCAVLRARIAAAHPTLGRRRRSSRPSATTELPARLLGIVLGCRAPPSVGRTALAV